VLSSDLERSSQLLQNRLVLHELLEEQVLQHLVVVGHSSFLQEVLTKNLGRLNISNGVFPKNSFERVVELKTLGGSHGDMTRNTAGLPQHRRLQGSNGVKWLKAASARRSLLGGSEHVLLQVRVSLDSLPNTWNQLDVVATWLLASVGDVALHLVLLGALQP